MDARLLRMRDQVRERQQTGHRQAQLPDLVSECDAEGLSWMRRSARLTRRMCEAQHPVIESDQRIVFTRTTPRIPPVYQPEDWQRLISGHTLHELGPISNICADWGMVLSEGLLGRRRLALVIRDRVIRAGDGEAVEFLDAAVEAIDGVLALAGRYALAARDLGRRDVAELLEWVPANPPRTFHEALQALRLLHAVVWLSGHYHVGLGRLDQYLWPYLEADLKTGVLDGGAAEALLEEFFISLNRDSDLYPGVQQGDNGQSLMLGGVKRDGSDAANPLTWMTSHCGPSSRVKGRRWATTTTGPTACWSFCSIVWPTPANRYPATGGAGRLGRALVRPCTTFGWPRVTRGCPSRWWVRPLTVGELASISGRIWLHRKGWPSVGRSVFFRASARSTTDGSATAARSRWSLRMRSFAVPTRSRRSPCSFTSQPNWVASNCS